MTTTPRSSLQEWLRRLRRAMTIALIVSNFAAVLSAGAAPAQADTQPSFPIRAAFYYPWFPEAWDQYSINPYTNYTPSLGFYDGGSQAVIVGQIAAMQYGGIQAGIASWWGQGSREDSRMPALLQAAVGTSFRWSIYYENESLTNPSAAQITSDLTYLRDRYGNDPSFLRINGRFVVFVYADGADACGMADRWKQANTVGAYIVLKVFNGYRTCASQPDGWHQYSPAVAADSQQGYSYAISPGFWQKTQTVRLARDLNRWNQNIQDMVASGAPFQLVTTFNEWGEGTSVESAQEWASSSGFGAYLDALHNNGAQTSPTATVAAPTLVAPTLPGNLPPAGDPVIAAAGDIACDPTSGSFNGGNGTATSCRQKAVSDLLVGQNYAAVLALGDIQYEDGAPSKYYQSYDLSWGRVKNITLPVVGNHEYNTAGASGYFSYFGAAAGDPTKGYYSYDIGAWHIIALNSNCSQVGGCGLGSPQELWLKADLAAHPSMCTLAYWHHPRFSSGQHGSNTSYDAFWKDLYAAGAELVLNGHDHNYERFAPQNPGAAADPNGIQEFVVGTGGKNHYAFSTIRANSVVRNSDTYGVLKLTLHATSYDWQFVPEAGKTFTDSGTRNCVSASALTPPAVPTSTKTATATSLPSATPTSTSMATSLPPTFTVTATTTNLPPVSPTWTSTATATVGSLPASTSTPTATVLPSLTPSQSAPSASLTFKPAADAYVSAAAPSTNYGATSPLRMDGNPIIRSYLTFNVQGLSGPIASAKLKVYVNSSSSAGFSVYRVPDAGWNELSLTYENAPALGDLGGSSGAAQKDTWVIVDVTVLVDGNGLVSLALTGNSSTLFSIASRERATRAPQLIITTR
ncbi:MAG: DNRLRE domain-containing protein [Anaerolineales bacterium]